jgi:hypothetical protein
MIDMKVDLSALLTLMHAFAMCYEGRGDTLFSYQTLCYQCESNIFSRSGFLLFRLVLIFPIIIEQD